MYLEPDWQAAEDADAKARQARRRKFVWPAAVAGAAGIVALFVYLNGRVSPAPQHPKPPLIQTVTLPPPPPPPPPKPQEKPPEPPKQQETKQTTVPPVPNKPPSKPSPPKVASANPKPAGAPLTSSLGVGDNPYGLARGNGGGDVVGGGNGDGSGGGFGYGFYAVKVQSQLQAALMRNDRTRRGSYVVVANLWLSGSGRIDRVEITQSSGNSELDGTVADVLKSQTISEAPPAGMPQPIRTRISARG